MRVLFKKIVIVLFICVSCNYVSAQLAVPDTHYKVIDFMNKIYKDNQTDINAAFESIIDSKLNSHDICDQEIRSKLIKYYFWHKLFTASSCVDGNNSGIWKIPYFWNWTEPNRRLEIVTIPDSTQLSQIDPPVEFNLYKSFAYIDRTPLLFLGDLFCNEIEYYHSLCGSFRSFGWCSEREMAFNAILELDGAICKIYANGNHSWTEIYLKTTEDSLLQVKIDNTFDSFSVSFNEEEINRSLWLKNIGNNPLSGWYNKKAKDKTMLSNLKQMKVPYKRAVELENSIKKYFTNS